MLWRLPLILQVFPTHLMRVGAMSAIGARLHDRDVDVLMTPAWSFELDDIRLPHIEAFRDYARRHPRHRLMFAGNTAAEAMLMSDAGFAATVVNQNSMMDEERFKPIDGVEPEHDAIYNARLAPYKRIDLAGEIDNLALLYYFVPGEDTVEKYHAEHARLRALMPRARFINELTPTGSAYVAPARVNEWLARSRVGLCLSAAEGAMRASIEYLFAGLPVVSTPSLGGRDRYFHDDYCIVADPDPRSIRDAVAALAARNIPRDYVRRRTLERVEADRSRYIDLVQGIIDERGGQGKFQPRLRMLIHGEGILRWRSMADLARLIDADPPPSSSRASG